MRECPWVCWSSPLSQIILKLSSSSFLVLLPLNNVGLCGVLQRDQILCEAWIFRFVICFRHEFVARECFSAPRTSACLTPQRFAQRRSTAAPGGGWSAAPAASWSIISLVNFVTFVMEFVIFGSISMTEMKEVVIDFKREQSNRHEVGHLRSWLREAFKSCERFKLSWRTGSDVSFHCVSCITPKLLRDLTPLSVYADLLQGQIYMYLEVYLWSIWNKLCLVL